MWMGQKWKRRWCWHSKKADTQFSDPQVHCPEECFKRKGGGKLSIHFCADGETIEREFVVDSGASMQMISKKNLSDAEVDTLTNSCSPSTVITAKREVQTHKEATVYVKELDIFLTMNVLVNTPAVLSLGKLFDENECSCEWINGQKPLLIKTWFEYNVTRRTSFFLWFF